MDDRDKKNSSDDDSDLELSLVRRKRRSSQKLLLSESSDTEEYSALAGEHCVQSALRASSRKRRKSLISSSSSGLNDSEKETVEKDDSDEDACRGNTPKNEDDSAMKKENATSGQHGRSSERIRIKKNHEFCLPSREKIWNEMDGDALTHKEYIKLKPKRLLNKFTRETSYYNFDPVLTSGEESMQEFLDDSEDRLLPLDTASSEASGKYHKKGKKKKISPIKSRKHTSSVSKSSSSSDSDPEAEFITRKEERIRRRRRNSKRIESDSDAERHIDTDNSDQIQELSGTAKSVTNTGDPGDKVCKSDQDDADSGIKALSDSDSQFDVCLSASKKRRKTSVNRSCVISDDNDDESSQNNELNGRDKCCTLGTDNTENSLDIDNKSKCQDANCGLTNSDNSITVISVPIKQTTENDTTSENNIPEGEITLCNCERTKRIAESVKVLWSESDELYTCTCMSPRTKPGIDWKVASNCKQHCDRDKLRSTSGNSSSGDDTSSNSVLTSSSSSDNELEGGPHFTSTRARKKYKHKERAKENKFAKFLEVRAQRRESAKAKQKPTCVNQETK